MGGEGQGQSPFTIIHTLQNESKSKIWENTDSRWEVGNLEAGLAPGWIIGWIVPTMDIVGTARSRDRIEGRLDIQY